MSVICIERIKAIWCHKKTFNLHQHSKSDQNTKNTFSAINCHVRHPFAGQNIQPIAKFDKNMWDREAEQQKKKDRETERKREKERQRDRKKEGKKT